MFGWVFVLLFQTFSCPLPMFGELLGVLGRDGVYLPEAGKIRYALSSLPCHSGKSMWPKVGQSGASVTDFELGSLATRNRNGEEGIPGAETLWQYPMSCDANSRVLTGQFPRHGGSGCHVSLCLCSFSKLVFQTLWKFCEQPNILSINPFPAGIIQSRVLLLATKNSGWFSLEEDWQVTVREKQSWDLDAGQSEGRAYASPTISYMVLRGNAGKTQIPFSRWGTERRGNCPS